MTDSHFTQNYSLAILDLIKGFADLELMRAQGAESNSTITSLRKQIKEKYRLLREIDPIEFDKSYEELRQSYINYTSSKEIDDNLKKMQRIKNERELSVGPYQCMPDRAVRILNNISKENSISEMLKFIGRGWIDWEDNNRSCVKAYIMACFSEISYLYLSHKEITQKPRYRILSSAAFPHETPPVNQSDLGEIEGILTIISTGKYVYYVWNLDIANIVVVRGTKYLPEWIFINFNAKKDIYPESKTIEERYSGFYHEGFATESNAAINHIQIRNALKPDCPTYFTGHSLGAAIAVLMADKWSPGSDHIKTPYLFACPRVADQKGSDHLRGYAHVRAHDVVPHLAPRFLGYADACSKQEQITLDGLRQSSGLRAVMAHLCSRSLTKYHAIRGYRILCGNGLEDDLRSVGETIDADHSLSDALEAYVRRQRSLHSDPGV